MKTFLRNLLDHFFFFLMSLLVDVVDKSDMLIPLFARCEVCNCPVEWALRNTMPSLRRIWFVDLRTVDDLNFDLSFFLGFSLSSAGITLMLGISFVLVCRLFNSLSSLICITLFFDELLHKRKKYYIITHFISYLDCIKILVNEVLKKEI